MIFSTIWPYLYYAFLFICCAYAVIRGSRSEYAGAGIMIAGSFATLFVGQVIGATWTGLEFWIFVIDLVALLALIHLTIISDRFWPMWATAFHLLAVSIHTAIMVAPEITPWAFATGATFWAYPMLLALAVGAHEYVKPGESGHLNSG